MHLRLTGMVAAAALLGATSFAQAEGEVNVISWGGAYTKSQVKAYHEPFTKMTGVKINSIDYNGGLAEVKAQVEAGNVTWDVVDVELSDAVRGCDEGLLEPIDKSILPAAPDGTPAEKDFINGTLTECAVAASFGQRFTPTTGASFPATNPQRLRISLIWRSSPASVACERTLRPT